jgi:protein TonB
MDTNKILQADVLDIIFDNRNKAYGAYELRKNYHIRLKRSMMIAATLVMVTVSAPIIASMFDKPLVVDMPNEKPQIISNIEVLITKEPEPKVPELKTLEPINPVTTVINTEPLIEVAEEVNDADLPPTKEELKEAVSGIVNKEGEGNSKLTDVPVLENGGEGTAIIPQESLPNDNEIFGDMDVSQMPEFPGGDEELLRYLAQNIQYPKRAVDGNTEGRVLIGFIVNKEGEIDDVKVIRSIGDGCDEEAVRVIHKMPKWKPGKNNGRLVNVFYNLPVTFQLIK